MRAYILAACLAGVFTLPVTAAPIDPGASAGVVQVRDYYRGEWGRGHWGYGPDCRELRRACLFKEDLGEVGRGNCQRYRTLCR
ncbi:hypothetical protein WOC76_03375 [Methylocystis sp. IM3]|uniref:hypothetical protein n=1 Tax=unclassified Methylocystis TaxID=2625913 RepID=UPI000FAF7CA5|nr:MAG: hypothetical protein EKK29_00115 [Hyphomicrobiales bacterium]